jgi:Leucine-rich repeat (LRR) protein
MQRITLGLLLAVIGCQKSAPPGGSGNDLAVGVPEQSTQSEAASNPTSADVQAAIAQLQSLGVKLTSTSHASLPDVVDCGDQAVDDLQIDWLLQLPGLKRLTIRQTVLTDAGWQKLSQLTAVEHLDLRDADIDNDQFQSLVSGMNNIRLLKLGGPSGRCRVNDQGLDAIGDLPNIKSLSLDGLAISGAGITPLTRCKQLNELNLAKTGLDDRPLEEIARLVSVRKLRLAGNAIGAIGLGHLATIALEELDVSECPGVDDQALVEIGRQSKLKRLNLWRTSVTDQGLPHIAQLGKLQWLNLDNTAVSDAGLDWLKSLGDLQFLHLGSTAVSDQGMAKLAGLSELKKLIVTRTAVTQRGVDSLQKSLPDISIQLEYVSGQ